MKTCLVLYATPGRQWTWSVALDDVATVADALELARQQAGTLDVPWDGDVGIFGELCARDAVPRDGDRIEIYRPLKSDPKESRRARARARKAARDSAPVPPRASTPKA
jgi:putative ubiquitin-RnfH superfamily antitoxin RatB of RatAB toxin-antitoxin module